MSKKKRKKKSGQVKEKKKPTYTEQKKEYNKFRKDIWNGLDLSKLYQETKRFKGRITPIDSYLYIQTPYYIARLDDLAKRKFLRKLKLDPNITCEYQFIKSWRRTGEPILDTKSHLLDLFKGGNLDVFPLHLFVEINRQKEDSESFLSFLPKEFMIYDARYNTKFVEIERKEVNSFDVELVSLLHKEESSPHFQYIDFIGVDRIVSPWLQTPLIWKSDGEFIYAYDGLDFPFMIFPVVKKVAREIDIKLWSNIFSWSAEKLAKEGD